MRKVQTCEEISAIFKEEGKYNLQLLPKLQLFESNNYWRQKLIRALLEEVGLDHHFHWVNFQKWPDMQVPSQVPNLLQVPVNELNKMNK